jgi:hypothetical protein
MPAGGTRSVDLHVSYGREGRVRVDVRERLRERLK